MADTTTTAYGLTKPEVGASEDTWGTKINTDFDSLDTIINAIGGKTAAGTLSYADSAKLVTTSGGVDITGALTASTSLNIASSTTVDGILDEDDMSSNSATKLATQQSIKAYVDAQVGTVDTLAEVLGNGNTTGGTDLAVSTGDDITFADNSKAIFGAGSDLQIYHDGLQSYVLDNGTGNLNLRGTSLRLSDASGTHYLVANSGAEVSLTHSGAIKLATTATGIDVTGTVTADGLTVDGGYIAVSGASTGLLIEETDTTDLNTWLSNQGGDLRLFTVNDALSVYTKRMEVDHGTGDISFYEDTGTTAKLTWDASAEMLTTSGLTVNGSDPVILQHSSTGPTLRFNNIDQTVADGQQLARVEFSTDDAGATTDEVYLQLTGDGTGGAAFFDIMTGDGTPTKTARFNVGGDISFYEDTGSTAKFFWDASAESLGIGQIQTSHRLNLGDNSGDESLIFTVPADGLAKFHTNRDSAEFTWNQPSGELMRIDSSGDLLVGTTEADVGYTDSGSGVSIRGSVGNIGIARSGSTVLDLNRLDSDGGIVSFRKDGSEVGSIGTAFSRPYFASANCGISPHNTANYVAATNSTGTTIDNTVDLGASGYRWKDLYLSGGVYLGGTGAANKLDDYEEGTWTPVVADASSGGNTASGDFVGRYTLIGNQCTVWCRLVNINTSGMTGSNNIYIRGVPFSSSTATTQAHGAVMCDRIIFDNYVVAQLPGSSDVIELRTITSNAQDQPVVISDVAASGGSDILFTLTYRIP